MTIKIKFNTILAALLTVMSTGQASQITNAVNITTDVVFRLTKPGDDSLQSEFKANEPIDYTLDGPRTNDVYLRQFPYGNFEFHLFDGRGMEVPKTKTGLELTRTPPKPTKDDLRSYRHSHFFPFVVGRGGAYYRPLFRPEDIFIITNQGGYDLEVRTRLCLIFTNGAPDLNAMTNGSNATGFQFFKDFDVLTSPPLRVRIIKE
jgi:hypothetical protein